jgi:hypothetical protein
MYIKAPLNKHSLIPYVLYLFLQKNTLNLAGSNDIHTRLRFFRVRSNFTPSKLFFEL